MWNCVYAKSSLWLDGFISWGYTISKPNIKRNFQSPLQRFTMTHSKCEFASDKITIYNIFSCHSCIWGQFFVAFCSFFQCSLTVFQRGRQRKSGGRQWKSWTKNIFFIFHPNVQISPKNSICFCLKINQFWTC